jgi:23S rRNA (guanosine2251-2'-O)-methyltransferase
MRKFYYNIKKSTKETKISIMQKLNNQGLKRLSISDFQQAAKQPISLVLDNIRSMHNIGAAFRIADAFLLEKIYLCGITACPPHREIHKTALGAENSVVWEYIDDTSSLVLKLKEQGYVVAACEQTTESIALASYNPVSLHNLALIFGNEILGVQDNVLAVCDLALEIPQYGTKHSLNVSVSMGIVVWEIVRNMQSGAST